MHLLWNKSFSASALHAAYCTWKHSRQLHDENLREKLGPAAVALGTCPDDLDAVPVSYTTLTPPTKSEVDKLAGHVTLTQKKW